MTGNSVLMDKSKLQKKTLQLTCKPFHHALFWYLMLHIGASKHGLGEPQSLSYCQCCARFSIVLRFYQRLLCSTVVIVSTVSTCVFYCSYCDDGLSSKTHCQCLQHYWLVPSSYSLKVIYIKHVFLVWCVPDYTAWY